MLFPPILHFTFSFPSNYKCFPHQVQICNATDPISAPSLLEDNFGMEDEYQKLIRRLNPPRVVFDNDACKDATVIQVDSVNKNGILLQVVQVLTDMDLIITKAYISSDASWFMDVFNVLDCHGNKVRDKEVINYIKQTLEENVSYKPPLRQSVGLMPSTDHTTIELTGIDRPGLLSELCAVLADLQCNVVNAEIWTHSAKAAAIVNVTDCSTGCAIKDEARLLSIKSLLSYVLRGDCELEAAKMMPSPNVTHRGRRLHQIMFEDRDFERMDDKDGRSRPNINVIDCLEKDYTIVTMRSKDRPKLLFDIVCTLTDMQYVVFHGMVSTGTTKEAYQEFYIRHVDGFPISSEVERKRVVQCLQAAIERRAYEGLQLELCTEDRVGLLSDITRVLRENGLTIRRAEILTESGRAKDTFYVTDVEGNAVDKQTLDSIQQQIGRAVLQVKHDLISPCKEAEETASNSLFENLFKGKNVKNQGK